MAGPPDAPTDYEARLVETAQAFLQAAPSRRMSRPEHAELTAEERRRAEVKRLWGEKEWEAPPPLWQAPTFSSPEVLKLLDGPHADNGQPLGEGPFLEPPAPPPGASDQQIVAWTGLRHRLYEQYLAGIKNERARFAYWCGLDAATRFQLAADVLNRRQPEGTPAWACSVPDDPTQPPALLLGPDEHAVRRVYKQLLGILTIPASPASGYSEPLQVVPHQAPAP
jgi:hypothetical protein